MKYVDDAIGKIIAQKNPDKIVVNDDSLLYELSKSHRSRTTGNFIALFIIVLSALIFIIYAGIYYIGDVLFSRMETGVNLNGAFLSSKEASNDVALFLFNASEVWADSGIQVHKGDKVKISVSGAFHRDIKDIKEAAENNCQPIYGLAGSNWRATWENQDTLRKLHANDPKTIDFNDTTTTPLDIESYTIQHCIYEDSEQSYCGSILYTVMSDAKNFNATARDNNFKIHQINSSDNAFQTVERDGNLHFAINDIYLYNKEIKNYRNAAKVVKDGEPLLDRSDEYYHDKRTLWYNDNLGEILVAVEIQRPTAWKFINIKYWYHTLYQTIDSLLDDGRSSAWSMAGSWTAIILLSLLFVLYVTLVVTAVAFSIYAVVIALHYVMKRLGRIVRHRSQTTDMPDQAA